VAGRALLHELGEHAGVVGARQAGGTSAKIASRMVRPVQ
jgi:hypothetical protein